MEQEPRKKQERWGCAIIASLIFVPQLYVLSVGPAAMIVDEHPKIISEGVAKAFYFPVIWLHDNTFLKKPLEKYIKLWIRE